MVKQAENRRTANHNSGKALLRSHFFNGYALVMKMAVADHLYLMKSDEAELGRNNPQPRAGFFWPSAGPLVDLFRRDFSNGARSLAPDRLPLQRPGF